MKRLFLLVWTAALAAVAAAWGQTCVMRAEIRGTERFAEELRTFVAGTQWEGAEELFERGSFAEERAVWEAMDRMGTVVFALYGDDASADTIANEGFAAVLPMKDSAPVYALLEENIGPEGPVEELGVRAFEAEYGEGVAVAVESEGRVTVAWSFDGRREAEALLAKELHESRSVGAEGTLALRVDDGEYGKWFVRKSGKHAPPAIRAVVDGLAAVVERSEWTEVGVGLRGDAVRVEFAAKGDWARGGGTVCKRARGKALDGEKVALAVVARSGRVVRAADALRRRVAAWAADAEEPGVACVLSWEGWEKLAGRLSGEVGAVELEYGRGAVWVEKASGAEGMRAWLRRHAETAGDALLRRLGAGMWPRSEMSAKWTGERTSGTWAVDSYALAEKGEPWETLEIAWGGPEGPVVASTLDAKRLDALLADWSAGRRPGAETSRTFRKRLGTKGPRRESEGFARIDDLFNEALDYASTLLVYEVGALGETPWRRTVGEWASVLLDSGELQMADRDGDGEGRGGWKWRRWRMGTMPSHSADISWRAGRTGEGVFEGTADVKVEDLRRWVENATMGAGSYWPWWE
ncbi:MAG: hypothetical protein IJT88_10350 [Kiritimatiellae bacterium]|nr:hypothetical protein [Kiritimatiellia bacterium]